MQKAIGSFNLPVFLSIRTGQIWNHGLGRVAGLFLHVPSPLASPQPQEQVSCPDRQYHVVLKYKGPESI